jgi:hypothetical protein
MPRKYTQEEGLAMANVAAQKHEGRCLATTYTTMSDLEIEWECRHGHRWKDSINHVKDSGRWCHECKGFSRTKTTLKDLDAHAQKHGGKCLTRAFLGTLTHHAWMCGAGHIWTSAPSAMLYHDQWCQRCYWNGKHLTIEDAQEEARKNNGECLDTKYVDVQTHMRWKCGCGNVWSTTLATIKYGKSWCPLCCLKKNQKKAHEIFETLTGKSFEPNKRGLLSNKSWELDGWNKELRIGFEYHGEQHYHYIPFFHHDDPVNLEIRKEIDSLKELECDELGIRLIVIPYNVDSKSFILGALTSLGALKK